MSEPIDPIITKRCCVCGTLVRLQKSSILNQGRLNAQFICEACRSSTQARSSGSTLKDTLAQLKHMPEEQKMAMDKEYSDEKYEEAREAAEQKEEHTDNHDKDAEASETDQSKKQPAGKENSKPNAAKQTKTSPSFLGNIGEKTKTTGSKFSQQMASLIRNSAVIGATAAATAQATTTATNTSSNDSSTATSSDNAAEVTSAQESQKTSDRQTKATETNLASAAGNAAARGATQAGKTLASASASLFSNSQQSTEAAGQQVKVDAPELLQMIKSGPSHGK